MTTIAKWYELLDEIHESLTSNYERAIIRHILNSQFRAGGLIDVAYLLNMTMAHRIRFIEMVNDLA